MRIAFIVQRYAEELSGGSENECREIAERLSHVAKCDVLTSCARSYNPWDNYFPEGTEVINGVSVHRFPVVEEFVELYAEASCSPDEEKKYAERGPYCPGIIEYLINTKGSYDVYIFCTYVFYPSLMGIGLDIGPKIMITTAHQDVTWIRPYLYRRILCADAYIFQVEEERELVHSYLSIAEKPELIGCMGISIEADADLKPDDNGEPYILYLGRVSDGKGCNRLEKYFLEYKKRFPSALKLVFAGDYNGYRGIHSNDILYTGFVSEEKKNALLSEAKCLIMPSERESLSIVILEAMARGVPILVNGDCEVLKGQCRRSNAGLYYQNYREFEKSLLLILTDSEVAAEMGENGKLFVKKNYDWNYVTANIIKFIEQIEGMK